MIVVGTICRGALYGMAAVRHGRHCLSGLVQRPSRCVDEKRCRGEVGGYQIFCLTGHFVGLYSVRVG